MATRNQTFERSGRSLDHTVEDLGNGTAKLAERASEKLAEFRDKTRHVLHEANNTSLADVEKRAAKAVRHHPGRTVVLSALAGFLVGFLVRHR